MAYDSSVISFTTKTNKVDLVDAAHINALQAELEIIETILGTGVKGDRANLKTRLNNALDADGSILSGSAFPSPSFPSQMFYRTDLDLMYVRDAANANWTSGNILSVFTADSTKTTAQGYLLASDNTSRTYTPNSSLRNVPSILKEYTLPSTASGSLWVKAVFTSSGDDAPTMIVAKNGVTQSSSLPGAAAGATINIVITGLLAGDKIQIMANFPTGSGGDTITNTTFEIYFHRMEASVVPSLTLTVDTDVTGT